MRRQVADRETAEDLAQESFARVYAAERAGTTIADPRALLYRTARNLVIDGHRHAAVRDAVEPVEARCEVMGVDMHRGPRHYEPEVALSSRQGIAAVIAAIDALPPRCREALVLSRFEGLSHAEVADRMGITRRTVEFHLKTALVLCERYRLGTGGMTMAALATTEPAP